MRILVVCSDTGVRIGGGKGAAIHLQAISHAFTALGHQVEVVGVASATSATDSVWAMPVHVVPHPGRSAGLERARRKLATSAAVSRKAGEVAAALRPQMIYERLSLFGTAGLEVAAATGATHVVEVNALLSTEETTWRGLHLGTIARDLEARVLATADLRVAVSDQVAADITPLSAGGPCLTVPNGVDTELFAARYDRARSRASFGLPADADLIGFTGSLRPWHGLDVALEALAGLPERVHLVVAGTGELRTDLAGRAEALGVAGRVHWLGHLAHDRVPQMLAACDLALAPYPRLTSFGFSPLKLYEYLAAGVPVVASDIGQIREVLQEGRWGTLVTPGDPAALARALTSELSDPGPGRDRAARARAHTLSRHGWTGRAAQIVSAASGPAGVRTSTDHLPSSLAWPSDHPMLTDEALRPFSATASALCAGARFVRLLRHLPGRRVTTLVVMGDKLVVVKVFASPRARGNARRLGLIASGPAGRIVPTSVACDPDGHIHLLTYHEGVELDHLSGTPFVAGCHQAGTELRRLHDCGVQLDRRWGWEQEVAQLERHALPSTIGAVREAIRHRPDAEADWVCAHRDCHPAQLIVGPAGDARWVDLDDCAMAPRSLDVGNMVAHLRRERLRGGCAPDVALAAEAGFLDGYRGVSAVHLGDLERWIDVAVLRLAALAVSRHGDHRLHDRLLADRSVRQRGRRPDGVAGVPGRTAVRP